MSGESAPNFGWTVQADRPYQRNDGPGQLLTETMLPDPDAQRAAGIDPDLWLNNGRLDVVDSLDPTKPAGDITSIDRVSLMGIFITVDITGMSWPTVTYNWGDGTARGLRTQMPWNTGHEYALPGTYTITVTGRNETGHITIAQDVTVPDGWAPPPAPTISAADPASGTYFGGEVITIQGSGFTEGVHS